MNIKQAIEDAENLKSKLTPEIIAKLDGLSAPRVWHLLNNLASQAKTYLEVGLYKGSTLIAALHGNEIEAYGVDNFGMVPNKRGNFFTNTKGYKFTLFEQDSWTVDLTKISPIELYFYDGDHSFEATQKALTYYYPVLSEEFVIVVDDWNIKKIPNAIFSAAKDLNLKVVENYNLLSAFRHKWWNSLGVIKFKKS